jgi:hypothetical protein
MTRLALNLGMMVASDQCGAVDHQDTHALRMSSFRTSISWLQLKATEPSTLIGTECRKPDVVVVCHIELQHQSPAAHSHEI